MKLHWQVIRYGIVGLASNGVLYAGYLLLTAVGVGSKTAMTILYAVGVMQTFLFNRRWTFGYGGGVSGSFVRYVVTYGLGYLLNLAALALLVDGFAYPHQLVQGVMIFVVAAFLFLLQKRWVFPEADRDGGVEPLHS